MNPATAGTLWGMVVITTAIVAVWLAMVGARRGW